MKKSNLFLVAIAAAFVFVSCKSEDETKTTLVDFEDVKLNVDSIWNGSDSSGYFITKIATFENSYTSYSSGYISWSGFACSAKKNRSVGGYVNQYAVSAGAGAVNSKQFAIAYGTATLLCDSNLYGNFSIKSAFFTNSTYTYLDMKEGSGYSKKFVEGDWFKVIVTGYLNNTKTNQIEYYLSDFREGKTILSNLWEKVDLSSLGEVDKVTFTFDSSDKGQFGMNTPAYACIDNIEFTQTISTK